MSAKDYNIACEPDNSGKGGSVIFLWFLIFAVLLSLMIWGLVIGFRFSVDYENDTKVGSVLTEEALDAKAMNEAYISGRRGLFSDKKNVAIETAMQKFLFDLRQGK